MGKKLSVYVKGDRNSSSYYRFYQYFDEIDGIQPVYHVMFPKWVEQNFSPVGYQTLFIKSLIYLVAYFRMLWSLLYDTFHHPDTVVVSRRIINRYMPFHFKVIFSLLLRRGAFFVWDFDDHILEGKELSVADFEFFSKKANCIFVTHQFLKSLINQKYQYKSFILPTTDGDMYRDADNEDMMFNRETLFREKINLVWVAYSVNLNNLQIVIPALDKAAKVLRKKIVLNVVCDKPLEAKTDYLIINNIKWTKKAAIDAMKCSHIGIMPLKQTLYSKGKGGFKLVQYISIGLPCIASNVGFNKEVVGDNKCGILVDTPEEWYDAVMEMSNIGQWRKYSSKAYNHWRQHFSYEKNLNVWKEAVLNHRVI